MADLEISYMEALEKYGAHKYPCAILERMDVMTKCTCGWQQVKDTLLRKHFEGAP